MRDGGVVVGGLSLPPCPGSRHPSLSSSLPSPGLLRKRSPALPQHVGLHLLWAKCCSQFVFPKDKGHGGSFPTYTPSTAASLMDAEGGRAGVPCARLISETLRKDAGEKLCRATCESDASCSALGGFAEMRVVCLVRSGCGTDGIAPKWLCSMP